MLEPIGRYAGLKIRWKAMKRRSRAGGKLRGAPCKHGAGHAKLAGDARVWEGHTRRLK
jgi:hypothetical protein